MNAVILGPGDVARLAPWCRLPRVPAGKIDVLLVVRSEHEITVERYRFGVRKIAGIESIALLGVVLHDDRQRCGVAAHHDSQRIYWPPLDVVQAALLAARSAR